MAGELNAYDAGASGGPDTSATGAGAFEAGLDDDVFAGADQYELGLDIYDPPQGDFFPGADVVQEINERVQQDVMGREEKYSNSEEAGVEAAGPPTPPPSDGPRQDPDNSVEDNNNNGKSNKIASKKPKSRRSQQPVRDRFTTLKAEEVLKNRAAYSDEMKKFNLVKDLERFEKGQKELLLDMMTALPSGGGPAFRSNQSKLQHSRADVVVLFSNNS